MKKTIPVNIPVGEKCVVGKKDCPLFCNGTEFDHCMGWNSKQVIANQTKHRLCLDLK